MVPETQERLRQARGNPEMIALAAACNSLDAAAASEPVEPDDDQDQDVDAAGIPQPEPARPLPDERECLRDLLQSNSGIAVPQVFFVYLWLS